VIWPSEIHKLGYCPRLLFFEYNLPRRRGPWEVIRLLLGRIYHAILAVPLRLRGYSTENRMETRLGNVVLRGRADAVLLRGDKAIVIERKSGRGPRREAWPSDVLQAGSYGVILARNSDVNEVILEIRYRERSYRYILDSSISSAVLRAVDDVVKIKYWGIVGYPRRSKGRCSRCPFREVCEELDKALSPPDEGEIYEPGEWVERERLSSLNTRFTGMGAGKYEGESGREGSHRG